MVLKGKNKGGEDSVRTEHRVLMYAPRERDEVSRLVKEARSY